MIKHDWLTKSDHRKLAGALDVLRLSFGDGAPTHDRLVKWLEKKNNVGKIAVDSSWSYGEKVLGVCLYKLSNTHITLKVIAVHPKWRMQGIGYGLVSDLQERLYSAGRNTVETKVHDVSMPDAHLFFLSCGFRQGWYKDGWTRFFYPYATLFQSPYAEAGSK